MKLPGFAGLTVAVAAFVTAPSCPHAQTNVDPSATGAAFAWSENGGWADLRGDTTAGVVVKPEHLAGYAWLENFGWLNLGSGAPAGAGNQYSNTSGTDFGVNNDRQGNLSGYAWGENIGWVNFNTLTQCGGRVTIDPVTGRFEGYAWGENVGWISFDDVAVAHVATVPASAVPVAVSGFSLE